MAGPDMDENGFSIVAAEPPGVKLQKSPSLKAWVAHMLREQDGHVSTDAFCKIHYRNLLNSTIGMPVPNPYRTGAVCILLDKVPPPPPHPTHW